MKTLRAHASIAIAVLAVAVVLAAGAPPASAQRTVGQVIDDATIATEIKAKLAADKISNLTKISVKSDSSVVTLSGTVDSLDTKSRAAQIASTVKGVKGVVNNIQVAAAATPGSVPTPPQSAIDATGTVARVDRDKGTITLDDGRVLKTSDQTAVWQRTEMKSLKPGTQVLVRGAIPAGFQPGASSASPEWWMGTVSIVDTGRSQIVLNDGTVVRVSSSTNLHRGNQRLELVQVEPGSEVVVRTPIAASVSGGTDVGASASPGEKAAGRTIDAAEVNVVRTPR